MHILPLEPSHIAGASALFAAGFRRLRRSVPILPSSLEDPAACAGLLETLLARSAGVAALEGDRLVGYLGWWIVDGFRNTPRRCGYAPVWAHAVEAVDGPSALNVYRALYAAAARAWQAAGCQAHAASLLADDALIHSFWFWNNFGALVVDAVRPTTVEQAAAQGPAVDLGRAAIEAPGEMARAAARAAQRGIVVRPAQAEDAPLAARLEAEHWQHYPQAPVLMAAAPPSSAEEMAALIADPRNRLWLAFQGEAAVGFLRFEGHSQGAGALVSAPPGETIAITGAYVRPAFRGQGAAPAMLHAALGDLARRGCPRCSVDFETFNPEASALWMKYFTPVSLSVMRVPEAAA